MLTRLSAHATSFTSFVRNTTLGKLVLVFLIFVIAAAATFLVLFVTAKPHTAAPTKPVAVHKAAPAPAPPKYYSPLTGLEVADQPAVTAPVTAVMIENSPDARPQSGLSKAGVVFEAIAEGGITRFAALFQGQKPALIGPVRSLRPYFLSWIAPFDASIAHVGGSALALSQVRDGTYRDIDQFFNAGTYWRATDRYAPHNVYTSGANLDALNAAKGYTISNPAGFTRVDPALPDSKKPQGAPATSITVNISGYYYDPSYGYEPSNQTYLRTLEDAPQSDREAGQLTPSVVIVMKVPTVEVMQDGYREQMAVIGSGQAYIFQRGQVFEGTWSKAGQRDQVKFIGADGKEIPLERGQTWITAIPTQNSVQWK